MAKQISKADKTSMVIDRGKVDEVRQILGTKTIAETVDAALEEVIRHAAWKRLMKRIRTSKSGGLGPAPEELRRLRQPR